MVTDIITPELQEEVHEAVLSQPAQNLPAVPFKTEVVEFSIPELAIQLMEEEFLTLTIAGPDDKKGFEYLHKCRMITKDQRIFVDKGRVKMKAPALEYGRKVDEAAKRIATRLEKIEDYLEAQERAYHKERERIADEKAKAVRMRADQRVQVLRASGFSYNVMNDAWEFGAPEASNYVAINFDDIRDFTEEDYQPTADLVKTVYEAEQQRVADEQMRGERADARLKALRALGFFWDAEQEWYSFTDGEGTGRYDVWPRDLMNLTDEEYEPIASTAKRIYDAEQTRLAKIKQEADELAEKNHQDSIRLQAIAEQQAAAQKAIDDARKQLETDRRAMILSVRAPQLEAAGFDWNGSRYKLLNVFRLGVDDVVDMTDPQFADFLIDAKAKVTEAAEAADRVIKEQQKRDKEQKRLNKERQVRLAPDKKAMRTWAIKLGNYPNVETTQDEATALAISFLTRLSAMAQEFVIEIDAL